MSTATKQLLKLALTLPADERAALADELLTSLDSPESAIDAAWSAEVHDRLGAYEAGEMATLSFEEVFPGSGTRRSP